MNKLHYISTTILILFSISMATAQTFTISGKVKDEDKNQALDYASLALIRLPDSTSIALQATNLGGLYKFKTVKPGKYFIKAIMMGYSKNQTLPFEITSASVTLADIKLKSTAQNLKEVNIVSKMPIISQKADRVIVNVEQMNTAGDNALEVIGRSPGVKLDKDDNITLKGKSGINVMIDGRMSYMSGTELTTYLKSLPASVLSKIELISNPPSSFDAAGTAGIINIKLKRNTLAGFNGNTNLGAGYGKHPKAYGGVNLNYNVDKISTYARLNAGYYDSYNLLTLNRKIGDEQYNQENLWHPKTKSLSFSTGLDYYISEKQTLGIMLKGDNSPYSTQTIGNSISYNSLGKEMGFVTMDNPQKNKDHNYATNLNYRYKTDTLGSELSFDADYVKYKTGKNESFTNVYFDGNRNQIGQAIDLINQGNNQIAIYAVKADYVLNLNKTIKLEMGAKSSWIKSQSNIALDSLKTAGWISDPKRTNEFLYQENINAGYLSINKNFKNLDVKVGFRGEQTVGKGNSSSTSELINRKYFKLFPTAFISYKIDSNNLFTAAYRKSVNRPNYRSLNPFTFYTDPYTAMQGNPLLEPSYSDSYEMNYSFKNFRILTISYTVGKQSITQMAYQNNLTKETITKPENLGLDKNLYLATGSPFDIKKWWNNNTEISVAYTTLKTPVQGENYNSSKFSWSVTSDNTFTLPKNYSLSFYGFYQSPYNDGLFKTLESFQFNLGAKKTFWKKNATISIKANDIFNTNKFRANLMHNNVNSYWSNEWESRKLSINFTYKFGNMKIKTAGNRKTGTTEEERRTGN